MCRMKGDGNCFFRALSHQLYGSDEFHLHVRAILVGFEVINPSAFEAYLFTSPTVSTILQHAKRMSCPGEWATQVELYAAATYFDLPLFYLEEQSIVKVFLWGVVWPKAIKRHFSLQFPKVVDEIPPALVHT